MPFIKIAFDSSATATGWLSVDGKASVRLTDGTVYKVDAGDRTIEIHTKTDAERRAAAFQENCNKFSKGAFGNGLLDTVVEAGTKKQAENAMGQSWRTQVSLDENTLLVITAEAQAGKIVDVLHHESIDLDSEDVAKYNNSAVPSYIPTRADSNEPKRSIWQIFFGLWGMLGMSMGAVATFQSSAEMDMTTIAAFAIVFIGCLLLFINGMRKKVRKKK